MNCITPDVGGVVRELRRLGLGVWVSSIENDVTIEVRGGPWDREVWLTHDMTEEKWHLMLSIDDKPVLGPAEVPLENVPRISLYLLEIDL